MCLRLEIITMDVTFRIAQNTNSKYCEENGLDYWLDSGDYGGFHSPPLTSGEP